MAELVELDGSGSTCEDCVYGACSRWIACDRSGCECPCRDQDGGRARELDDRPDAALANIARDLEHEARPDVAALTVERFGRPGGEARRPALPIVEGPRQWLARRRELLTALDSNLVPPPAQGAA